MRVSLAFLPFISDTSIVPLAPALLKGCLGNELQISTYDFNIEYQRYFDDVLIDTWFNIPNFKLSKKTFNNYIEFVNQCATKLINSDVIGLSVFSHNSLRFAEDLCYALRNKTDAHIVLGGMGVQIFLDDHNTTWAELMLNNNLADCVVFGEAETLIYDVIKNKKCGLIKHQQLISNELLTIPIPDFSDTNWDLYDTSPQLPITGSKGCVRDCSFCDVRKYWPKFTYRSGQHIAEEMISHYKKYNISSFIFTDSLINGGMKPFREMNEVLSNRLPNTIRYTGQFICRNQQSMSEKDFKLMASSGCYKVNIGIESGSEKIRDHMRKKFTNDDIHYTASNLIKNNIEQSWNIIVGYPNETDKDWQDTLDLLKQYSEFNNLIKVFPVGLFIMIPGTPMYDLELINELEIDLNDVPGYTEYFWTSGDNTFPKRVDRYFELIDLLLKHDMLGISLDRLERNNNVLKEQLKQYESL